MNKRETPYDWCKRVGAKEGDEVVVTSSDPEEWDWKFTIGRIDDDERKVFYGMPGVWTAREWREMDRECSYELVERKGA